MASMKDSKLKVQENKGTIKIVGVNLSHNANKCVEENVFAKKKIKQNSTYYCQEVWRYTANLYRYVSNIKKQGDSILLIFALLLNS